MKSNSARESETLLQLFGKGFHRFFCWARTSRNRRFLIFLVTAVAANIAYSVFRAAHLKTCDLVNGYLTPTRAILFDGKDPYVDFSVNSFSPFFYLLFVPLALLPNGWASLAWSVLNVGFVAGILVVTQELIARANPEHSLAPAWVGPLLAIAFIADNFYLGQSNLFTLFFVCCAAFALSRRRDFQAGLLLSVAIAWKITPAFFLVYLFCTSRVRALVGTALGLVLWLFALPSLLFGMGADLKWLKEWSALVIEPFILGGQVLSKNVGWHSTNQSLEAFVTRHLTPYGRTAYGGLHNLIDPAVLNESQAHMVSLVAKVAIVGLLAFIAIRSRKSSLRTFPLEISIVILGALFVSPVSWYNHYVVVLVPYVVMLEEIRNLKRNGQSYQSLAIPLGLAVMAGTVSLTAQLRSYSLVFVTEFLAFLALIVFTIRSQNQVVLEARSEDALSRRLAS